MPPETVAVGFTAGGVEAKEEEEEEDLGQMGQSWLSHLYGTTMGTSVPATGEL